MIATVALSLIFASPKAHDHDSGGLWILYLIFALKLIHFASSLVVYAIMVVQGFRTRLLWGLANLFLPISGLAFLVFYPRRAIWAVKIVLFNVALYIVFVLFMMMTHQLKTH